MPPKIRSRGGCATCKKRRRKCDETRPACLVCQQRCVTCEGYEIQLQWNWGIASRGSMAGATVPILRRRRSKRSHKSSSESSSETSPISGNDLGTLANLNEASSGPAWDYQSPESHRLFDDYFNVIVKLVINSTIFTLYNTSTDSPLKEITVDLCAQSPACFAACLALQLFHAVGCTEQFFACFDSALQVFRSELVEAAGTFRGGTLNAGLYLCTISLEQGLAWTSHLQCMADLYGLREGSLPLRDITHQSTYYVLEMIAVMDLPNLVFGRQTPCIGIWNRLRRHQRREIGGVEIMTGLPRTLIDILAQPQEASAEEDLWLWEGTHAELLQIHFWDAWRYTGILLMRRDPSRVLPELGQEKPRRVPSTPHLLQNLIVSLNALRLGLEHPESNHLLTANGMFFPYMIARSYFRLLRCHPEWTIALNKVRDMCLRLDSSQNIRIAQALLDEGWDTGVDVLDIDQAAREKGVELAVF